MKSIHFTSPVSPSAAKLGGMMPDVLRHLRVACLNGAAEGGGISGFCKLLELQKGFLPGEEGLGGLMFRAYAAMALEPSFLLWGSAVPFFLSPRPKGGYYFLHKPHRADQSTPLLLLIHGYGGNLLYFPWAIHRAVPEAGHDDLVGFKTPWEKKNSAAFLLSSPRHLLHQLYKNNRKIFRKSSPVPSFHNQVP